MKRAALTFSFDDCFRDTVKISLKELRKRKIKATFNVAPLCVGKKIDNLKVLDWKDLRELCKAGMEIASHSLTHTALARKSLLKRFFLFLGGFGAKFPRLILNWADIQKEIFSSKKVLEKKLGTQVNSFVYPGGAYNSKLVKVVKEAYNSARTVDRGFNDVFSDKYKLKVQVWTSCTTAERANSWVKRAVRERKWLIEVFHVVSEKPSNYPYTANKAEFIKHLDYVKSLSDIRIGTQNKIASRVWENEKEA